MIASIDEACAAGARLNKASCWNFSSNYSAVSPE